MSRRYLRHWDSPRANRANSCHLFVTQPLRMHSSSWERDLTSFFTPALRQVDRAYNIDYMDKECKQANNKWCEEILIKKKIIRYDNFNPRFRSYKILLLRSITFLPNEAKLRHDAYFPVSLHSFSLKLGSLFTLHTIKQKEQCVTW